MTYDDPFTVIAGAFLTVFLIVVAVETLIGWGAYAARQGSDDD
jgi:hypothetical protein